MHDVFRFPYPEARADIVTYALAEYPRECCGVITVDRKVVYARNVADNPTEAFEIDPEVLVAYDGQIACIFHSHTNGNPDFSLADITAIRNSGTPWFLFDVKTGQDRYINPNIRYPLVGRPFVYGFYDCWNLVRDWYWYHRKVELPWYDYGEPGEWCLPQWNKMLDAAAQNDHGFRQIDRYEPLQEGDVLFFCWRHFAPNHLGVYVGDNMFIHHCYGRLSHTAVYGGWYREITHSVWRYVGNDVGTAHQS